MKAKITEMYTQAQIQNLCGEIKIICKKAYESKNRQFLPNTHIPTYDILAEEINGKNNNSVITPSWLRDLFMDYTKKLTSNINQLQLDCVCQYLRGVNSKEYFSILNQNINHILGVFNVYWKGTTTFSINTKTSIEYQLKISQSETLFIPTNEKEVTYVGNLPTILIGNAYIELTHPNRIEKVYIILHVGIAEIGVEYISGIYLGVDSGPHPCSGPILIVKEETKVVRVDVIEEYFNRYGKAALTKGYTIDRMKKMVKDLKTKTNKDRIKGLFGNWIVHLRHKMTQKIDVGKLKIENTDNIEYDSFNNQYDQGELSILGDQNLRIQLSGNSRYACLLANIGSNTKLSTIKFIIANYVSTGSFTPTSGFVILERTDIAFDEINIGYYDKDDEIFKSLKENDLLSSIMSSDNNTSKLRDAQ